MLKIQRNPTASQLRWFGLLWLPAFCGMLGFLGLRFSGSLLLAEIVWGVGVVLALAGMASRPLLRLIYLGLIYLTWPIGWVVSHTLLLITYYLVLTPVGLALRLVGRDGLRRRLEPDSDTYWEARPPTRDTEGYFRQY